jgi:hypothetical protein
MMELFIPPGFEFKAEGARSEGEWCLLISLFFFFFPSLL